MASHFAHASEYREAITFGTWAARQALSRSATEETVALSRRALKWNEAFTGADERDAIELELSGILYPALMAVEGLGARDLMTLSQRMDALSSVNKSTDADDIEPGAADNKSSATTVSQVNPINADFMNRWVMFQDHHFRARIHDALELGETLLSEAQRRDDRIHQMLVLPLLGQTYHWSGDLSTAQQRCTQALALYHDDEDTNIWTDYGIEPKSQAQFLLAHVLCHQGHPDQALALAEESLAWATHTGCTMSADGATYFQCMIAFHCDNRAKVIEATRRYEGLSQEAIEKQWLASLSWIVRDWAIGDTNHTDRVIAQQLAAQRYAVVCWYEITAARTQISLGEYEATIDRLERSINRCEQHGEKTMLPLLYCYLGVARYHHRHTYDTTVSSAFEQGLLDAKRQGAYWCQLTIATEVAEILLDQNRPLSSLSWLEKTLNKIPEGYSTPLYIRARKLLGAHFTFGQQQLTDNP